MNGTEKQISWAAEIREGLAPKYTEMIVLLRAGEYRKALPGGPGRLLEDGQPNAGHASQIADALQTVLTEANAAFWIEHRSGVQSVVSQMMDYLRRGKSVVYSKWVS
jgi:hypothetical protein